MKHGMDETRISAICGSIGRSSAIVMAQHASAEQRKGNARGLHPYGATAQHGRDVKGAPRERVQAERAEIHGRHLSVGEHEAAGGHWRARHGGGRGVWRGSPV